MSVQLTISAFLETSAFDAQTAEREERIRRLLGGLEQVDEKTKSSFNKVMGMMRGSYMVISGIARVMGPGFSRIFQGIWSVVTSTIMFYKSIQAAMMASPVPGAALQAMVMMFSIIAATANVAALMAGQKDLARQTRGMNFALHGISSMISSFSI